jgi:lipopolysaccharide export system permease protein
VKILDRYLLRELAGPFLLGLGIFILVFIAGDVLVQVLRHGMALGPALYFLVLSLPKFLAFVLPMASLLAVLMAFGRLSGESELVAMHAAGLSFPRLALPVIAAGVLVSLVALGLNESAAPWCNAAREDLLYEVTRGTARGERRNVLFQQEEGGEPVRIIAAARLKFLGERQEMREVVITQLAKGRPVVAIFAETGTWNGRTWTLRRVTTHLLGEKVPGLLRTERQEIDFGATPEEIGRGAREPEEMSYRELKARVGQLAGGGQPVRRLLVELQRKLSLPFASLVFVLIGAPLALRSPRGGSSIGIGLTIFIAFAYYLLWQQLTVIAESGGLPPALAAWLPNALFGGAGAALIASVRR